MTHEGSHEKVKPRSARGRVAFVALTLLVGGIAALAGVLTSAWAAGSAHFSFGSPASNGSWLPIRSEGDGPRGELGFLHLVVQPQDCPEILAFLGRLARTAPREGLSVGGTLLSARGRGELALPFPAVERSGRTMSRRLRAIGVRRTPVILVLTPEGRLLAALSGERAAEAGPPSRTARVAARLLEVGA